jgi:hypothetical protein
VAIKEWIMGIPGERNILRGIISIVFVGKGETRASLSTETDFMPWVFPCPSYGFRS